MTLANQPLAGPVTRPDSHETIAPAHDAVLLSGEDHVISQPVAPRSPVATPGSGSDIVWSQLGIGLGVGVVLAFGLMLASRATRQRPLAH